jgi:hypothetical protein
VTAACESDQARPPQARDGLCDEPLGIGLGDDDDGLALLGLELVRALGLEVVDDDAVDHGALLARAREAQLVRHDVLRRAGAREGGEALLVARVVRLLLRGRRARGGAGAVADRLAHALKVRDGDQAARAVQRVARLVPVRVVFAADDVQKVALREAKIAVVRVGVGGGGFVVVERLDDLRGSRR